IIFMGASQFAVPTLEKLAKNNYQILAVITAPDKPAGRQQELTPPPVKELAGQLDLKIFQPIKIAEIKSEIKKLAPDLIIAAAYGQIIPQDILEIPSRGALNLHPSLLPKYRGPSPIQTAVLNGEQKTGLTIMLMDEKIDHGPIIGQKEILIAPDETYQTLERKLAQLAADYLLEILPQYLENKTELQPQDDSRATQTKILTRDDGKIDLNQDPFEIERKTRAFYPWPGVWTESNGLRVKIIKVKVKDGRLYLELVQPQGKKQMTGQEFFRGHKK
ncbi:MAG: methionyl-tRNA formyltransferase, partial [Patescibacteria group bacterium]